MIVFFWVKNKPERLPRMVITVSCAWILKPYISWMKYRHTESHAHAHICTEWYNCFLILVHIRQHPASTSFRSARQYVHSLSYVLWTETLLYHIFRCQMHTFTVRKPRTHKMSCVRMTAVLPGNWSTHWLHARVLRDWHETLCLTAQSTYQHTTVLAACLLQ